MSQKPATFTHHSASGGRQSSETSAAASSNVTLEQQRAAHALAQINGVRSESKASIASDYKSYAESISATIVMNGLGQAAATLLAQAKGEDGRHDAHRRLFDHLEDWLCDSRSRTGLRKPLMESLINGDQSAYCHAQAEALAYLVWLKKFAQAFITKSAHTRPNSH